MMLRTVLIALTLMTGLLAACADAPTAMTTAPAAPPSVDIAASRNEGPFRTTTVGGESAVMLEGHDAVAYFTQDSAVRGQREHALQHQGVTWWFASAANKAAFASDPLRYMPQFGGYCSNGINYAIPGGGGGGANAWRIYRGKLYVFGGQTARDHFEMDTELNLKLAHHHWQRDVSGRDAQLTRVRMLASRVAHYKSDAALQREYDAKLAAGTLPVMPGGKQVVPR